MGLSAFQTLDKVVDAAYVSGDIFSADLDFSKNTATSNFLGTPVNLMREIQVQFITDTSGILSVTFDGTNFFNVNNGDTITGAATFTIFVDNTTLLNFSFNAGASIIITVGG